MICSSLSMRCKSICSSFMYMYTGLLLTDFSCRCSERGIRQVPELLPNSYTAERAQYKPSSSSS